MVNKETSIQMSHSTKAQIRDIRISQSLKDDESAINYLLENYNSFGHEQEESTAPLKAELTRKNDLINKLTAEIDQARQQPAGDLRTVPASGKLSIEKYAGKKVMVQVVS